MEQLNKAHVFSIYYGFTTRLSVSTSVILVVAFTPTMEVLVSAVVTTQVVSVITLPDTTPEVERLNTVAIGFSIHESLLSPYLIKRTRDDNPLTPDEEGSSK